MPDDALPFDVTLRTRKLAVDSALRAWEHSLEVQRQVLLDAYDRGLRVYAADLPEGGYVAHICELSGGADEERRMIIHNMKEPYHIVNLVPERGEHRGTQYKIWEVTTGVMDN